LTYRTESMIDWHDVRLRQAALTPTDTLPQDHNLHYYHANGGRYAVLSPRQWRSLRKQRKLDSFLEQCRDSGVVITLDQ